MTLDLEPNEIQFLLQVLGELPTKTGAFVLVQNIAGQYESQTLGLANGPLNNQPNEGK